MYRLGLKIWSINTEFYLPEARRLHDLGLYDYIELYTVPGNLDRLQLWQELRIPFVIHNPHFAHGFNLAKRECEARNREIYEESARYADALHAERIIFHGGMDGTIEETARQLRALHEPRALLENKPYAALPNRMGGQWCRGATLDEVRLVLSEVGCGLCLDFGHAICSANSQGIERYGFVGALNELHPVMYHLSDLRDIDSPCDSHLHLGTGQLDLPRIASNFLGEGATVSLETEKVSERSLEDFGADVEFMRGLYKVGSGS